MKTLFERIGGQPVILKLIEKFYARVFSDPELSPFFAEASMEHLKAMQLELFSEALDGPVRYTRSDLSRVHRGRGITRRHLSRFVEHLVGTLRDEQQLSEQDVSEIISRIATRADSILGEDGGEDG
jgi:hemoglobin